MLLCSLTIQLQAIALDSVRAGLPVIEETRVIGQKKVVRINADLNWTLGISAAGFFKDYQSLLRGPSSGFDAPIGFSVGMSSYQVKNAPIGLSVSYYRAVARETYQYKSSILDTVGLPSQTYSQDITLTVIPIMLTWDYYPIDRQFTGYIGGGIGAAPVHAFWREDISESTLPGSRLSGTRYDAWHVAPSFMGRVGVSLGFDEPLGSKTKAGVYFEASYLFVPYSAPLFTEAAKTIPNAPPSTKGNYTTQSGGFVVRLGMNIFFMGNK